MAIEDRTNQKWGFVQDMMPSGVQLNMATEHLPMGNGVPKARWMAYFMEKPMKKVDDSNLGVPL